MKKEIRIEKLKARFQFLVLLGIFYPVVLGALYGGGDFLNKAILNWTYIISAYICIYLFLEFFADKAWSATIRVTSILVPVNIFLYVPIMIVIADNQGSEILTNSEFNVFAGSLIAADVIPAGIFIMFCMNFIVWVFKEYENRPEKPVG